MAFRFQRGAIRRTAIIELGVGSVSHGTETPGITEGRSPDRRQVSPSGAGRACRLPVVRVFFANHSTAPVNLGGAERSLLKLVDDWCARRDDLEPVFLTKAPEGEFIKALKRAGHPFKAYRFRGWAVPSAQPAPSSEVAAFAAVDYATVTAMIADMERLKPDLVVTNTLVAPWAAFAAAVVGIPHAWFVREYGDLDHGLQFQSGRGATFRDIGLLSGAVITNSLAMKEHIAQYVDRDVISVAYPAMDATTVVTGSRESLPVAAFATDDDALKITVVGRVEPGKGQHRVIDALAVLADRGVAASVCVVGSWKDPGYDLELMRRARAAGVADRVELVGEQSNPYPFVAAADVCVTPSTLEAFGRTTLEYMILGKPVVAANTGGSAELVEPGTTGELFELDAAEGLADALELYARDRDRVKEHGAAGARRIARLMDGEFSNDAAIDRLEGLVGSSGYRLPEIARYWFALPAAFSAVGATTPRMAVGLLAHRLLTRTGLVGRVLRRPAVLARRLLRR
jgi:glycosyltransferase involved in cell wall biosynthesis